MEKKIRYDYIDLAKIISILLIVISHQNILNAKVNMAFCSFYIVIFFICSGITFNDKHLQEKEYLFKYVIKLIKYYLFYSFLLLLAFNCYSFITHSFSFDSLINGIVGIFYSRYSMYQNSDVILMNCSNAPMWFLTCYIVSYSLYYSLKKIRRINKYIIMAVLLVISYVFTFINVLLPWSLDTVPYFVVFMYIGEIIRDKDIINKTNSILWIIMILVFVGLVIFNNTDINLSIRLYGNSMLISFIMGILGSIIMLLLCNYIEKLSANIFHGKITEYLRNIGKGGGTLHIMCYHLSLLFVMNIFIRYKMISVLFVIIIILLINNFVKKLYDMIIK